MKFILLILLLGLAVDANASTECEKKIVRYFIGTSEVDQSVAHLWVNFEGGGSASMSSNSAAFEGMLSTVITSITTDKKVVVRYFSDGANCQVHNGDWVGIWMIK